MTSSVGFLVFLTVLILGSVITGVVIHHSKVVRKLQTMKEEIIKELKN